MVKNPSFTNKKKLGKDQTTLDSFIVDFKESKYLKTTIYLSNKYHQTKLDDFKSNLPDNRIINKIKIQKWWFHFISFSSML